MTGRVRRSFIEVQEAEQDELVAALRDDGAPHAVHLADKLTRCRDCREKLRRWGGRPDLRHVLGESGRYRCEHHACWSCRRAKIRQFARKEAPRFCNADNEFCSHLIIADSVTGDLAVVRQRVAAMARALRDRRDATATTRLPWRSVEVVGHVELDPHLPHDEGSLAPDQKALIPTLPVLANGGGDHMWIVRAHLAVRHDGISRDELVEVFGRQWQGAGRVHAVAFHDDKLAQENAGRVISYGIKSEFKHDVGEVSSRWPVVWQAEYWSWLHQMGRGLQPLRISVGAQQVKADTDMSASSGLPVRRRGGDEMRSPSLPSLLSSVVASSVRHGDDEPLPVSFGVWWSSLGVHPP